MPDEAHTELNLRMGRIEKDLALVVASSVRLEQRFDKFQETLTSHDGMLHGGAKNGLMTRMALQEQIPVRVDSISVKALVAILAAVGTLVGTIAAAIAAAVTRM